MSALWCLKFRSAANTGSRKGYHSQCKDERRSKITISTGVHSSRLLILQAKQMVAKDVARVEVQAYALIPKIQGVHGPFKNTADPCHKAMANTGVIISNIM